MTRGGEPLSAAAVAVQLRRFWLGEAADERVVRRSDLGDVWRDVTLIRVGSTLTLYTPYDFGIGDPLDGRLGSYLTRRVLKLSEGAVRKVAWDFDPVAAKPATRRARTGDLDIHAPGDPGLEEYDAVRARLSKALPAGTSEEGRGVLSRVGLAAVSRHRMWFAAPDAETEKAVRTTSGAAYALHAAVRAVQKGDPLLRVVVEGSYTAAEQEEMAWT
jgi:hypothetical protein